MGNINSRAAGTRRLLPSVSTDQASDTRAPTWHCANPNLQVDGMPFAVGTVHAKIRRAGYRTLASGLGSAGPASRLRRAQNALRHLPP
jgi:hypothetical protein